jgi:hypothetical protein
MSFKPTEKQPTEQDLKNYSYQCKTSQFFENPGKFLKEGQRVRAKFRIWDLPQRDLESDWGWVSAEKGETGTVVHAQDGLWPTVQFDETGASTCVTDFEVEVVDNAKELNTLQSFFEGLSYRLRNPYLGARISWPSEDVNPAYMEGVQLAEAFIKDVQSGQAPGIGLVDMLQVTLHALVY